MNYRTGPKFALLAMLGLPVLSLAAPQQTVGLDIAPPLAIQRALHIGPSDPNKVLHLAISMPFADANGMERFVNDVSNPKSPNYRHFITPSQVGQQFGLPQSQVQKVVNFLKAQGMKITLVGQNRLSILADATVGQAQSAFGVQIDEYLSKDKADAADPIRFSFTSNPKVPAELGRTILSINGLEDFTRPQKQYLTPSQARTLYGTATMYNGGSTGTGRTIGISSWDGFRLSNAAGFISYYGLPVPSAGATSNVKIETLDGGSGAGTQNVEGDLDIQCALAIAPLASIIVYDGYGGDIINVLTQEVNDNSADIITESYGWSLDPTTAASAHNLHLSMSAQGITYLAASGDSGTTITYGYPDYDPEVLVVGGTSTTTNSTGVRTTETGWSGSGGGWITSASSSFNVKPSYQSAVGPSGVNYRLVPDIAANADPNTGFTLYLEAGSYPGFTLSTSGVYSGFGGTSAASPTMAASLADAEQQIISLGGLAANSAGKRRFGRINDLLYSYNGLSSVFFDVTSGSNGTLPNGSTSSAATGWDTVTGWGALNFQGLVNKVVGTSTQISSVSLSTSTIEGGNGTSVTGTVTLNTAAPAGGQVISLTSSNAAATVPSSITIAAGAASGTFSVTTASVSASTAVTITGSMTGSSATASLTLTAPHPSSVSLGSSSIVGGTTTTATVKIAEAAPAGGLVVTLASSNTAAATVPASVTVAAGATTATFTVTSLAVASTSTATITAKSGNGSASSTLTVTAPTLSSLSLSASTIKGNGSNVVTGTITLNGAANTNGVKVSLKSSNTTIASVPSSVTVASGAKTVTFTFKPAKPTANTSITITATLGTTSKTATLTVTP